MVAWIRQYVDKKIECLNYKNDEHLNWDVDVECDKVRITSTIFNTEECCDFVIIDKSAYSGTARIDQIIEKRRFKVSFNSDSTETRKGFSLTWSCVPKTGLFILIYSP